MAGAEYAARNFGATTGDLAPVGGPEAMDQMLLQRRRDEEALRRAEAIEATRPVGAALFTPTPGLLPTDLVIDTYPAPVEPVPTGAIGSDGKWHPFNAPFVELTPTQQEVRNNIPAELYDAIEDWDVVTSLAVIDAFIEEYDLQPTAGKGGDIDINKAGDNMDRFLEDMYNPSKANKTTAFVLNITRPEGPILPVSASGRAGSLQDARDGSTSVQRMRAYHEDRTARRGVTYEPTTGRWTPNRGDAPPNHPGYVMNPNTGEWEVEERFEPLSPSGRPIVLQRPGRDVSDVMDQYPVNIPSVRGSYDEEGRFVPAPTTRPAPPIGEEVTGPSGYDYTPDPIQYRKEPPPYKPDSEIGVDTNQGPTSKRRALPKLFTPQEAPVAGPAPGAGGAQPATFTPTSKPATRKAPRALPRPQSPTGRAAPSRGGGSSK